MFKVRVWNGDNYLNKHIQITSKAKNSGIGSKIASSILSFSYTTNYFYTDYISHPLRNALNYYSLSARSYSTRSYKYNRSFIKPYSVENIDKLNKKGLQKLAFPLHFLYHIKKLANRGEGIQRFRNLNY